MVRVPVDGISTVHERPKRGHSARVSASSREDARSDGQDRDLLNGGDMSAHQLRVLRTEIQEVVSTLYLVADAARLRGDADVRGALLLLARHLESLEADLGTGAFQEPV